MTRRTLTLETRRASSLWHGLAGAIASATSLFSASPAQARGLEALERETDRIRLQSRHWLL